MTHGETGRRLKAYEKHKRNHGGAVLLFRAGGRYELYQEDAEKASSLLGVAAADGDGLKVAAFHVSALDAYLPKLIFGGCKVAICELQGEEEPS